MKIKFVRSGWKPKIKLVLNCKEFHKVNKIQIISAAKFREELANT